MSCVCHAVMASEPTSHASNHLDLQAILLIDSLAYTGSGDAFAQLKVSNTPMGSALDNSCVSISHVVVQLICNALGM